MSSPRPSWKQSWPIFAILAIFIGAGLYYFLLHLEVDGDDLSSSYVGCTVITQGNALHLYAHDPENFAAIGPDDPWQHAADTGNYQAFLHPYVQTPLWAYSLLPLCTRTSFHQFEWVFAVASLLSFAACIVLVARHWAPTLFTPLGIAATCLLLWFSEPFTYAMTLMQTHIFIVLAMIAGLLLAQKNRPVAAGLLVAVAAAIKITPALLILYWLARRNWKAAASAAIWSALLWLLTAKLAGPEVMHLYSQNLHRVADVLLVSRNNQSFAAWFLTRYHPSAEIEAFRIFHLPTPMRLTCTTLLALTAITGGLLDFRSADILSADARDTDTPNTDTRARSYHRIAAPLGGLMTVIAASVFAPIEWTHYSIILIAPLMVLAHHARLTRSIPLAVATVAILALNLPPLAPDLTSTTVSTIALLRSHFYAEILCLATLTWLLCARTTLPPSHRNP